MRVFTNDDTEAAVVASLLTGNFVADVSNDGVTPGYPTVGASTIEVTCTGAVRIEAWGATGLLDAADDDNLTYNVVGDEKYVRLVAVGDYTEPFDSLPAAWVRSSGTWSATGGVLTKVHSGTSTFERIVLNRHRQGDFAAQFEVTQDDTADGFGLMFNVLNTNYYYYLRIGASTVAGWDDMLAVGYTTTNGFSGVTPLDATPFVAAGATSYTVKMQYTAATGLIEAKVWETGTAEPAWMISATDTTWRHGGFGFRANGAPAIDNLYIRGFETFYQPIEIE